MLAELNFWQEFWLAVVAAIGVALGVGGGIVVGFMLAAKQARHAFEHQHDLAVEEHQLKDTIERDRQVRGERLAVYGRLVSSSGPMVHWEAMCASATDAAGDDALRAQVSGRWAEALADVQLIGSMDVIRAANELEALRTGWSFQSTLVRFLRQHRAESTTSGAASVEPNHDRYRDYVAEGEAKRQTLIDACRADIAKLQV